MTILCLLLCLADAPHVERVDDYAFVHSYDTESAQIVTDAFIRACGERAVWQELNDSHAGVVTIEGEAWSVVVDDDVIRWQRYPAWEVRW